MNTSRPQMMERCVKIKTMKTNTDIGILLASPFHVCLKILLTSLLMFKAILFTTIIMLISYLSYTKQQHFYVSGDTKSTNHDHPTYFCRLIV